MAAEIVVDGAKHTVSEIAQQPMLWREIAAAQDQEDPAFLTPLLARPALRIVLTGAGSSAFAGQVLAPALARRLARRIDAVAATDIVANPKEALAEDVPTLLVSFARSGDSPESVAATDLADSCLSECWHVVVTCNPDGQLAGAHAGRSRSRVLLLPAIANDRGFAMTSSFTGMILRARMALDDSFDEPLVRRLAEAATLLLGRLPPRVRELAARDWDRLVYLGSGALRGLAAESALKTLELTAGRVVAISDSALGFRHGPKAVLNERTLVVVYMSNDSYTRAYDSDIVAEVCRALPARNVIAIAAEDVELPPELDVWPVPGLPEVDDAALALPAVLGAQLLAVALSLSLDCTPDNPFRGGEVNRVVQGVTVHPLR